MPVTNPVCVFAEKHFPGQVPCRNTKVSSTLVISTVCNVCRKAFTEVNHLKSDLESVMCLFKLEGNAPCNALANEIQQNDMYG